MTLKDPDSIELMLAATMRAVGRPHAHKGVYASQTAKAPWHVHVSLLGQTERPLLPHHIDHATDSDHASFTLHYSHDTAPMALRGQGDYYALVHKWHDHALHQRHRPEQEEQASLFDRLEQERIILQGRRHLHGVGVNIDSLSYPPSHMQGALPPDLQHMLGSVLRLHAASLNAQTRQLCEAMRALAQQSLPEDVYQQLIALPRYQGHQERYAHSALALIHALLKDTPQDQQEHAPEHHDSSQETPPDIQNEQIRTPPPAHSDSHQPQPSPDDTPPIPHDTPEQGDDVDEDTKDTTHGQQTPRTPPTDRLEPPYRIFTHAFDEVIDAQRLCAPTELTELRVLLDKRGKGSDHLIIRLAKLLQRRLMAKQKRWWEFDRDEGLLDASHLARLVATPHHTTLWKEERAHPFKNTVVTLLIDNSGSMRGRPITVAALCADILARTLERCAIKVEILGFTTVTWKGGKTREEWIRQQSPENPGRLNQLRHIIYKHADTPWRRARTHLGLMLRDGLLKENIDGEALLWAHQRLKKRHEERRILIVISDGAPVDDSTCSANHTHILEQHLTHVVRWIETSSPVELLAIGIGYDVSRYYTHNITIDNVDSLAPVLTQELAHLFDISPHKRQRTESPSSRRPSTGMASY